MRRAGSTVPGIVGHGEEHARPIRHESPHEIGKDQLVTDRCTGAQRCDARAEAGQLDRAGSRARRDVARRQTTRQRLEDAAEQPAQRHELAERNELGLVVPVADLTVLPDDEGAVVVGARLIDPRFEFDAHAAENQHGVALSGERTDRLPQFRIPLEGSGNRGLGPDDPFRPAFDRRPGEPQVALENALTATFIPFLALVDVALDRGDPNPRRVDQLIRGERETERVRDDEHERDPSERTRGDRSGPARFLRARRGGRGHGLRTDPPQRDASESETDRGGDEREGVDATPACPCEQRQIEMQRITQRGPGKAAQEPAAEPIGRDPGTGT